MSGYNFACMLIFFSIALSLGCVDQSEPDTYVILDKSKEAMAELSSCTYSVESVSAMYFTDPSDELDESDVLNTSSVMNVSVDFANKKAYYTTSFSEGGVGFALESYYIGDTAYLKLPFFGWVKNRTEGELWRSDGPLSDLNDLTVLHAERLEDEYVGGADCYVINYSVDFLDFAKASGLISSEDYGNSEYDSSSQDDGKANEVEITRWISKDDYITRKIASSVAFEWRYSIISHNFSTSYVMTVHSFNEPVDITLPEDAKNAVDITNSTFLENL